MEKLETIIVINLEKSIERKEHMISEFARNNIVNYEFFNGINSESDMVKKMMNSNFVKKFPGCFRCNNNRCKCVNNVLIPNQIGNWCSFIEVMKIIIERDYKNLVMICEDDIKFTDIGYANINKMLNGNNFNLDKPLLIRLGGALSEYHNSRKHIFNLSNKKIMSNPAFIINKKFALSFIKNLNQITHTSDVFIHKKLLSIDKKIQHFTLLPLPIYDLSFGSNRIFPSLIHPKGIDQADIDRMNKHIKRLEYKEILCIGHPRCGTKSISQYLHQLCNYKIGHEKMGYNGISNWMMCVNDDYPFGENINFNRYYFKDIIHIVRNPYDAIPSIILENKYSPGNASYKFKIKHINMNFNMNLPTEYNFTTLKDEVEIALLCYLYWNELCDKMNPSITVHIENIEPLKEYLKINNCNNSEKKISINMIKHNSNKPYKGVVYEKPLIPISIYKELNTDVKNMLFNFCKKYNYKYINE